MLTKIQLKNLAEISTSKSWLNFVLNVWTKIYTGVCVLDGIPFKGKYQNGKLYTLA